MSDLALNRSHDLLNMKRPRYRLCYWSSLMLNVLNWLKKVSNSDARWRCAMAKGSFYAFNFSLQWRMRRGGGDHPNRLRGKRVCAWVREKSVCVWVLERERTQVDKYAGGLSMGVGEGNQFNMQTGGIAVVHGSFGKVSPVSLCALLPSLPHKKGIYF